MSNSSASVSPGNGKVKDALPSLVLKNQVAFSQHILLAEWVALIRQYGSQR